MLIGLGIPGARSEPMQLNWQFQRTGRSREGLEAVIRRPGLRRPINAQRCAISAHLSR
jgi:hypothetical protein